MRRKFEWQRPVLQQVTACWHEGSFVNQIYRQMMRHTTVMTFQVWELLIGCVGSFVTTQYRQSHRCVFFFPAATINWRVNTVNTSYSLRLLFTVVKQSLVALVVHVGLLGRLCSIQWNRTWLPAFFFYSMWPHWKRSAVSLRYAPKQTKIKAWKTDGLMWDGSL